MGTHVRSAALIMGLLLVGLSALAWAAPEEPAAGESCDALLEMGITENAKGLVYYYDERRPEMWATLGTRHGLRPEAVVAFVREDEIVAEGVVTDVRHADCIIAPAPGTPAGQVLVGDQVLVLTNGPREALDRKIAEEERGRMVLSTILAAWMVAAYLN